MTNNLYVNSKLVGAFTAISIVDLPQDDAVQQWPSEITVSVELPIDSGVVDLDAMTFRAPTEDDIRARIRSRLDFNWRQWLESRFGNH